MKFRVFWDVAPCSNVEVVALMMEAVRTSETSVHFNVIHGATSQMTLSLTKC
jgi:hypothetical protein